MQDNNKSFKQVDEKHLVYEVEKMLWSPKTDLIAVTMASGEVILHRLSWQKVWVLPQPKDNVKVTALAWKPDGRVLALGFSDGKIRLCGVHKGATLHEHKLLSGSVTSLSWCDDKKFVRETSKEDISHYFHVELNECYKDKINTFCVSLPSIATKDEPKPNKDNELPTGLSHFNILLAGDSKGNVVLLGYGLIPLLQLNLSEGANIPRKVLDLSLTGRWNHLTFLLEEANGCDMTLKTCAIRKLNVYKQEITFLALKIAQLAELESYMVKTLNQMTENWEDILIEMETKLKKFAKEKMVNSKRSLKFELLWMLVFGPPSDSMRHFLQFDLTKQSLNRLGSSVESSYKRIQDLIIRSFQVVIEHMMTRLRDMLGMVRWKLRFGELGLDEKLIQDAISKAGSLYLKSGELQQVISESTLMFKAFHKWLYPLKLKYSGETVPPGVYDLTLKEGNYIADFLEENFGKPELNLEKVGQYLRNENLVTKFDYSTNLWQTFLTTEASESYKEKTKGVIFDMYFDNSLRQVMGMFQDSLKAIREKCSTMLKEFYQPKYEVKVEGLGSKKGFLDEAKLRISSSSDGTGPMNHSILVSSQSSNELILLRNHFAENRVEFCKFDLFNETIGERLNFSDVTFYKTTSLAVLLGDKVDRRDVTRILQLDTTLFDETIQASAVGGLDATRSAVARASAMPSFVRDVNDLDESSFKVTDDMKGSEFAVSGERKVLCLLNETRKKVKLYLTETEDDADASKDKEGEAHDAKTDESVCEGESPKYEWKSEWMTDDNDKENYAKFVGNFGPLI